MRARARAYVEAYVYIDTTRNSTVNETTAKLSGQRADARITAIIPNNLSPASLVPRAA